MKIEPAGTGEADRLADLWVDLAEGQRAFGSHVLAADNRTAARESLVRHAVVGEVLVAREDDRVLGFVSFVPESGGFERDVDRGVVENLFVVPGRRSEGIGTALLEAAEERLADAGADLVTLEAMADNEDALRFYRQRGYAAHRIELERETDTSEGE